MTNTQRQEWKFGKTDDMVDGPWKNEPDKVQWIDPATGLDCLIVRNLALCGYVGVPPEHPWWGVEYSACTVRGESEDCQSGLWCGHAPETMTSVHGGLTFSGKCDDANPQGICHIPAPGRPANVWWFGFDCAHAGDLTPKKLSRPGYFSVAPGQVYRDVSYVEAEATSLAAQLAALIVAP